MLRHTRWTPWIGFFLVVLACGRVGLAERNKVQVLFDFEEPGDVQVLRKWASETTLDVVQDYGVTRGKNCCRVVGRHGAGYAEFQMRGAKLKGWEDFDYFGVDVYLDRDAKLGYYLELWDESSRNYHTRCTFETARLHKGMNNLMWKINRAKRNNKEGRTWEELEPKDKIRMDRLKLVKLFMQPFKEGGDTVLWIDNLRLLQEDAVGGEMTVKLPAGARAFDFGNKASVTAGFAYVGPAAAGAGTHSLSGRDLRTVGKLWPDPLTGDAVASLTGPVQFDLSVPDGEYRVWISAGKVLDPKSRALPFLLQVGDQTLCDEELTDPEFYGEKGLFRHLRTQYSERPNALWLDYVNTVCPSQTVKAKAAGGKLSVKASNHRLAALVVLPAKEEMAFQQVVDQIREERLKQFYAPLFFDKHERPTKQPADGSYVVWMPHFTKSILPWTGPSAEERNAKNPDLRGAIGQRIVSRVCVTAFEDLGMGDLEVSDLVGPGRISAAALRRYYQNYRVAGTGVGESALLPWTKIRFEKGLTWAYWLWLAIPEDAAPGVYKGTLTFKPERGGDRTVPISLEVYPFRLEKDLPVSYGMYYGPWSFPKGIDRRKMIGEQLAFMREVGFTATYFGSGVVSGLRKPDRVNVRFDPMMSELAKEAGMGRLPEQQQMGTSLGMARAIARRMGMSPAVDQNPGIEFTREPELKKYYLDAVRQYEQFIRETGMPVAVEVVDEPREVPNPWNRNLEHTIKYADWIHEASGLKTFVTPMGDTQSGKDYTSMVDHIDIVSVHATASSRRMMEKAKSPGKTLWFYNTGMDRFSWGFYNWRMNSKGRWEWHWSWGRGAPEGYPCPGEWYTPMTGNNGFAMHAPYWEYPGGFLFKSAYLRVAQGINDYAYLVTLERAITRSDRPEAIAEAKKFLEALRQAIPDLPRVRNLASPEAGALVGAGIDTPVAGNAERWRHRIAELLKKFGHKG